MFCHIRRQTNGRMVEWKAEKGMGEWQTSRRNGRGGGGREIRERKG
jgi:hypothetical protein